MGKAMVGWLVKRLQRPSVPCPPALDGCHGWWPPPKWYTSKKIGSFGDDRRCLPPFFGYKLYQVVGQRMNQIRVVIRGCPSVKSWFA